MEAMIELNDTKAELEECIAQVEKTGKALIISRGNKPVAKLIPHMSKDPLIMDPMRSRSFFVDDPVDLFPSPIGQRLYDVFTRHSCHCLARFRSGSAFANSAKGDKVQCRPV